MTAQPTLKNPWQSRDDHLDIGAASIVLQVRSRKPEIGIAARFT
jgi:hypothetical protein